MNANKEKIIIITGITASGKSSLAIELAKYFNGEIINADSVIFYKYLNIGSAKPSKEELSEIKHHLINILEPVEHFTAYDFAKRADKIIKSLSKENKLPIIVGGSPLYIKALLKGFFEIPKIDKKAKDRVQNLLEKSGKEFLHEELKKVDLESAEKLHPNDIQRVSRALEVYYSTNNKLSDYHKEHNFKDIKYKYIKIALDYDREVIYNRINKRVDQMINNGLIEEVKSLVELGYRDEKVMRSIGYSEIISYLDNKITKEEAINKIKQHTRNFAKRQTTWLKKEDITWLKDKDLPKKAIELIENFI